MKKIILTDSNTLKQIRPSSAEISYYRVSGNEIKELIETIEQLESSGDVMIENKIKRDGISYGLYLQTGSWYPAMEETIVDVPYEEITINFGTSNPTSKDVNLRENWDKGYFDLEARILYIKKNEKSENFKKIFEK